ncbi:glycosyltransferase family 4 protein [Curtobacterium flaccumfaciens pv. oortii]|uniref:glycosyltransferase family 4 protein n=1 Tax=Curtobacterium flaccumfaciens TaxID=2035 RepID=UPI001BDE225D|nr:glycosyltransferase family 4 protein [Curtobacterium flaccumfaciens]MBT1624262.1 glycosyltransferase family 4 protein [Curtobacterium flaccumfaciens pv. oortii]
MKVLMLSGIFAQSAEYRATHMPETPDTLLAAGLVETGIDVTTAAPSFRGNWSAYDVVHLNHLTNACVRSLVTPRARVVFTPHFSGWKPVHHRVALRATERRADRVVVFTEDERRRMGGRVPDQKVAVIRNALDVQHFSSERRRRPRTGEPWELLYVGQLVEFKRVHLALRLLQQIHRHGERAVLRIVSHRESLRADLELEARRLGVEQFVEYLGSRDRAGIGREMRRAHMLVLPSYREGQSTVAGEAIVSGLPVHMFDVAAAVEQVPRGWEIPAIDNLDRWVELGCERLMAYEDCADAFASQAPIERGLLSIDRAVREHTSLYEELIESRP